MKIRSAFVVLNDGETCCDPEGSFVIVSEPLTDEQIGLIWVADDLVNDDSIKKWKYYIELDEKTGRPYFSKRCRCA